MPNEESLPDASGADAPKPSKYGGAIKKIFDEHPSGDFQEIIRTGYRGLDRNDLDLAKACADHVLTRAESGSGDMLRAMLLRSQVFERSGNSVQCNALISDVVAGRF
ncbi:MAG: hypothetical protein WC294_02210 [Methanoregula sp.]|jgi:hypothetical protein